MEKKDKKDEENDGQLFVWQGYTGKVELISFKTFLTKPVRRVALGGDHSLILTYDDCLFACGSNQHGQLGCPNLGREYSFDPCLVDAVCGKGIQQMACGANHSACIDKDGSLYSWGDNQHGQCAIDPSEHVEVLSPSCVELSSPGTVCKHGVTSPRVKEAAHKISCGATHTVALGVEGNVWVWGRGPQLGLGDVQQTWQPTVLKTFLGKKVIDICSGDFHNAVLVADGKDTKDMSQEMEENTETKDNISKSDISETSLINISCVECMKRINTAETKVKAGKDNKQLDVVLESAKSIDTHNDKEKVDKGKNNDEKSGNVVENEQQSTENKTIEGVTVEAANDVDVNEVFVELDTDKESKGVKDKSEGRHVVTGTEGGKGDKTAVIEETKVVRGEESQTTGQHSAEKSIYDVYSTESKSGTSEDNSLSEKNNVDTEGVELRKKSSLTEPRSLEDILTASIRSDSSQISNLSSKSTRSRSFLDETGAREYLARQFQDEDKLEVSSTKLEIPKSEDAVPLTATASAVPSSPGGYMMQTVSTLTSHVSSMTTKALSNIASVPGKFRFTGAGAEEETKSSTETLEVSEISDLETGSTENITGNLDKSILDCSNLTVSDTSLNASQLSLPESEKSNDSGGSLESSPVKRRKDQSSRRSVSKESQSIRTIEAKQENLRKRSLSLLSAEEKHKEYVVADVYMLDTEIWTWGRGSKGQLGLGDMLDRTEPYCVQILTGRRIVKLACGSYHTVALSSTGEVYSWGQNDCGQLGHNELSFSPARIELTYDCCAWCVDAGSNHTVFLMDSASTQGNRPEVFFTGKHPCKDLYVPIYKTGRLTPLKFLKKAGWICSVTTGGDNCACVSRQETDMTQALFEVTRFVRELHRHLQQVTQDFVKRIQMSGFFTSLEVQPYKSMIDSLLTAFTELSAKVGTYGVELTDKLVSGESILTASLFTFYDEFVSELKKYSTIFEDMVATGAFEYCAKNASTMFEVLQEFYRDLLKTSQSETKADHAAKFREIMFIPLKKVKEMSTVISKFSELFKKPSKECNLLSSVHLNLEHFVRMSQTAISDADNTRMFWESSATKISDSLKSASRRLIKESRSCPLSLLNAGRFSTHTFYLFNDLFIHAQYSNYQSYPLETVWIDLPSSDSTSQQNVITVTTPEDVLTLTTTTSQIKVEWVVAFNTAINKVLASQKTVNRQNSGERVHTPVIRLARHTFTKHALYKEGNYRGYWLNGKVHGSGLLKWPDGRKYRGRFKHGSITGSGKMVVPKENDTEEVQEGTWKNGKLHGHGKIKYSNGDLYDGYFKDAMRHGHGVFRKGKYLSSASFVYVGEWLFDKKHGYGVMDDILKGEKYMGMWQEDSRHGDGVVVTLDGMYFEGNFQHDKLTGNGLMLTDDNSCYEGEFAGITMLQGKGCLTFPSGDKIDGTFSGTWNQGLKISGTFHKIALSASMSMKHSWHRVTLESVSSLFGKLCVKPERKWEEIFYQCYDSLHYSGEGEPNTHKAWDHVVSCIVTGKQGLKERDKRAMSSKQKLELSNLEQLEKVPTHSVPILTTEHYSQTVQYLHKAFETRAHPLGKLMEELVDVFRAAYIGIGAHPRLLFHAVQELQSYIKRIYRVIRTLFPELPGNGDPSHIYPEKHRRASTPIRENMGFIQRQISEVDEDVPKEVVSAIGLLQPILLPKIYPALFDLYALHNDREDEKYWERVMKLNKQGDMSLMAYLGIDQSFWCLDGSMFEDKKVVKFLLVFQTQPAEGDHNIACANSLEPEQTPSSGQRISSIRDHSYSRAVDVLQQISTAFCPLDKLEVIQRTFMAISQAVQEYSGEEHIWCMDDLFPIFQFVVIRARIHHLGAEIHFIEELMESYLEFGELGIMFTTLKACYYQILNEKMPIH